MVCGVLGVMLLSGCSEEVKTREWYMDHPKDLATVYTKCKSSGNDTPNCRNAIAAQLQIQQKNAPVPTFNFGSGSDFQDGLKSFKENGKTESILH